LKVNSLFLIFLIKESIGFDLFRTEPLKGHGDVKKKMLLRLSHKSFVFSQ